MRRTRWWIVPVGIIAIGLPIGAAVMYGVWRQSFLTTEQTDRSRAMAVMNETRAQLGGTPPYVDLTPDGRAVAQVRHELHTAQPRPVSRVRLMFWRNRTRTLYRAAMPYWFARTMQWKTGSALAVAGAGELSEFTFQLPDLAPRGPGLVLDHTQPDGDRLLVWAE